MIHGKLVMKDLLMFGRLVFLSMENGSKDFVAYLEVMGTNNIFESIQAEASS